MPPGPPAPPVPPASSVSPATIQPVAAADYDRTRANMELLLAHRDELNPDELARLRACMRVLDRGYRSNPILDELRPNVHPKQSQFLALNDREVMFGGAAGGGKSDALLMAALQYVDVPGYSAILFRKTFTDLSGEGALMDRAQKWFAPLVARKACSWSGLEKSFFFKTWNPDGTPGQDSRIAFGYLDNPNDKMRYAGWEFQFVGFDELVQHPDASYRFLFSRLRRLLNSPVPIRMRSATNPGGVHGESVKERFIPKEYLSADIVDQFRKIWRKSGPCVLCDGSGGFEGDDCPACEGAGEVSRVFVPSKIDDNPSLDRREYLASLAELPPTERAQLQHGRWDVVPDGELFLREWFRYYSRRGDHFVLHTGPDERDEIVPSDQFVVFHTADTASKTKTYNDWTVIATWALDTRNYNLMLLQVIRRRMKVPELVPAILNVYRQFDSQFVMVEDASSGIGLIQELRTSRGKGINVRDFNPHTGDVVSRATPAIIRAEAGQIYLPSNEPPWLADYMNEVVSFSGDPDLHDDCVDTLSMAAWHVSTLHNRVKAGAGDRPRSVHPGPLGSPPTGGPAIRRW